MLPPSPIREQQPVVPPENDGGKLGKGYGKAGSDELLPGASLNTHEEAMQLLRVLGKLGACNWTFVLCFALGLGLVRLVLAYPCGRCDSWEAFS